MYSPRHLQSDPSWLDGGTKCYTLSVAEAPVAHEPYLERLREVKAARGVDDERCPSFAIFHRGAEFPYLVFAWWDNDNELFTSVSVLRDAGWVEDPERYSFCLHDLEVFHGERDIFIRTMYSGDADLAAYRREWYRA